MTTLYSHFGKPTEIRNLSIILEHACRISIDIEPAVVLHAVAMIGGLVHNANVKAGWWTDLATGSSILETRSRSSMFALVHSELSEGLEAYRKGLKDDKLPNRLGIEVELADAFIRLADILGAELAVHQNLKYEDIACAHSLPERQIFEFTTPDEAICVLHYSVSRLLKLYGKKETGFDVPLYISRIVRVMREIVSVSTHFGYDIAGAVVEKLAYNAKRADHKPENRALEGGKKI